MLAIAAPARAASAQAQSSAPAQAAPPTAPGSTVRPVGTVKSINGSAIALATDAGPEVTIQVQDTTRIVRIPPGQKI